MGTILLCASSGIGHLNAMIALADKLHTCGVRVRYVCPDNHSFFLVSSAPEAANFETVKLFETEAPALPAKAAAGRFVVKKGSWLQVPWPDYSGYQSQFESMLRTIAETDDLPAAVIFDTCTTWAWAPASKLFIPTYALGTVSAINLALDLYSRRLSEQGGPLPSEPFATDIPGLPPVPASNEVVVRMEILKSKEFGHVRNLWDEQVLNSDGLLLNSSYAIDGSVVKAMQDGEIIEGIAGKVYAVGPLMRRDWSELSEKQVELLKWLDEQPPRSVLFITFGSWEGVYEEQVVELAAGLEASGCRFLWMEAYEGEVPAEFRKKMANQGLIACGFAPQKRILTHPSVGAFLTHCGWNSVVECLSLGGIPMVAWGLIFDQPANAILVAHIGAGVEPLVNADGIVERKEAEKAIRLVMEGETAEAFRARAAEIKEKILSKKAAEASEKELELLLSKMLNKEMKSASH